MNSAFVGYKELSRSRKKNQIKQGKNEKKKKKKKKRKTERKRMGT